MLRMLQSRIVLIVVTFCLMGHFCFGTPGDKGLVLGVWNPASFTTFTEIPRVSSSSFNNVTLSLMPSNVQITSMASDPKEAVIFASIKDAIYIYHNFSIWQNASPEFSIQFRGKSVSLGQIAFDFVSKNLYWCDSLLHWIAMKPAYNFNHTIYKVIVHKDLNQPEGLALDPEEKLMFFSDNEPNCRIERASLDGRNRVVIVHNGLSRVFSLTVDTTNNRLFWADHVRQTLESCSYDGTNRRVIRRMNSVAITGLTYFQNTLHVVSSLSALMFGVDTTSGSELYSRAFLSVQPFTVLAYDAQNPGSFNNPCLALRCEHMCINIQSGPKCVCSEGFQLNEDATTCIDRSWFYERGFIVSNASLFAMHEVHSTSGQSNEYYHLSVSGDIIGTFAVDSNSDIIYYSDSRSNSLKKLDLISQQASTIASISSAKDMMFDWIANLLGWIETSTSSIRSFSVDSQTNVAIYSSLQQPTSLTVNPYSGALYWISGVSMKSIFRGSWTKETPVILISSANLNNPSSLKYDVSSNRLYWLDITILKSALTNGTDIKSHIITSGATEIFVYKGFFGWISGNKIYFARKSATSAEDELNTVENSKDVALFDTLLQQDRRGTCDILNGGCGEICIPEENGRRCECDVGLQLQTDQSCDSEILLESFIVVIDYTHGRILQIDLQNGTVVKLPISINRAPGLVFDKSTMTLFYAEASSNTITSTTLHGQNSTLFYATGFAHADRLAIDYSTGNLYYTAVGPSTSQSYIGVLHRSTSLHKTLLSNLHSPRDIALYPSKGYMFWTEFGNITEIGRTSMDGTSKIYIATTQIGWPNGLTIDFTSSRLYWTDGQNNRIESSDLNGGNRQVLATDSDAHLMSIVIHGQYLYYTAWNRQRITKMDKRTGSKVVFMSNHPEIGRLDSLDIYGDESQDVSISCSNKNGFCSTFCFPTPTGRTCGCQDNVNIQSDQLTCEGVSRCPTVLQNLNFLDCQPYPGQSCNFECKTGYRLAINTSVSCGSSGQWNLQTDTLCEAILCPVSLGTAVLSTNCNRRIGDSCSFSCTDGYRPTTSTNLVCNSDGTWNMDTNTLCFPILCPVSLGTAVLSTNCSRSIGDSCSFSCTDGYRPTTSTNLVCTTDGTWNVGTNTLCSPILCPVTLPKAVLSPNCSRRIGDSCPFSCTDGNLTATSTNVVCTTSGSWNQDTNTLCSDSQCSKNIDNGQFINCQYSSGESCRYECYDPFEENPSVKNVTCSANGKWSHDMDELCVKLCSPTIKNGNLETKCQRKIGNSCLFTCDNNYKSSIVSENIVCTTGGTWNENTDVLCQLITCPIEVINGNVSSSCRGMIGEKCDVKCGNNALIKTVPIVCLSSGDWDKDTSVLCSEHVETRTTPDEQTNNSVYVYAGLSVAGVVVVVSVVIGIYCMKKRRDNSTGNPYEGHATRTESSGYSTFGNIGFDDYSTIEDIGDPNKNPYLTAIADNESHN